MSICPVCNGFMIVEIHCHNCRRQMIDVGRIMDYYDDYSPYVNIDLMKRVDGYPDTFKGNKCPHLYHCPHCDQDTVIMIEE